MRVAVLVTLSILVAGCTGREEQRVEARLVYGPWVHHVAINECTVVSHNRSLALPFAVNNRTAHDVTNVTFSFSSSAPLMACLANGTVPAGPAENDTRAAFYGCASGESGETDGLALAPGSYTLVLRCNSPQPCSVRYSLRVEGTGDPAPS